MVAEKLKAELEINENNQVPADPIVDYLIQASKLSDELAIAIKQKDKTLEKCFDYVLEKVKEKLNNHSGYVDNQEVYDMACSYYLDRKVNIVIDNTGEMDIKADEIAEKDNKIKELEEKIRSIQEDNTQEALEVEINKELQEKDNRIKELEERIKNIQESNKQESLENMNKETKKKVKKSSKKNINIDGQISLF